LNLGELTDEDPIYQRADPLEAEWPNALARAADLIRFAVAQGGAMGHRLYGWRVGPAEADAAMNELVVYWAIRDSSIMNVIDEPLMESLVEDLRYAAFLRDSIPDKRP
jgi:hypothetical protein